MFKRDNLYAFGILLGMRHIAGLYVIYYNGKTRDQIDKYKGRQSQKDIVKFQKRISLIFKVKLFFENMPHMKFYSKFIENFLLKVNIKKLISKFYRTLSVKEIKK